MKQVCHGQQSDITQKEMTATPQSTGNYQSMAVNDSATIDDLTGNFWSITHITGGTCHRGSHWLM